MIRKKDGFINQRAIVLPQAVKDYLASNELTSLLYVTDIGYYPHADGHYRSRPKGTEQNILIYCTEGKGWVSFNGETHRVSAGQFFIIQSGLPHSYGADDHDPWTIYWLHFTGTKSHLFQSSYNKIYCIDIVPEARLKDRIMMFEEIYQNLDKGYSLENLEYTTLCLWHFIASFKFISQYREVNKVQSEDIVNKAIVYMKQHIGEKLSLEDIALSVNYSRSYFGQYFLKKTGYTPVNYFNQLKIQKACQLLDFSGMRMKEIANELGFYDQYHFSKVFFKEMGETPTQYKQRKKG